MTGLLQQASGDTRIWDNVGSIKAARELVNFTTRWDEMLLITGAAIDELEFLWTGAVRSEDNPESSSFTEEF
jgi:hypothetical protein